MRVGKFTEINPHKIAERIATPQKGASQSNRLASASPKGTPKAAATEKEVVTKPNPAARRWGGTRSEATVMTNEPHRPPKIPQIERAKPNMAALWESAHPSVPTMNPK